jgi:hypothetical protein
LLNAEHVTPLPIFPSLNRSPSPDWRNQAINICDGFTIAFGAEFDTGTRTIQNFHFNSPGVAPVANKSL